MQKRVHKLIRMACGCACARKEEGGKRPTPRPTMLTPTTNSIEDGAENINSKRLTVYNCFDSTPLQCWNVFAPASNVENVVCVYVCWFRGFTTGMARVAPTRTMTPASFSQLGEIFPLSMIIFCVLDANKIAGYHPAPRRLGWAALTSIRFVMPARSTI